MEGIEVRVHCEMCMHVDEAGQDGDVTQVDFLVASLLWSGGRRSDSADAVSGDDDGLVRSFIDGVYVNDVSGTNERRGRLLLGCERQGENQRQKNTKSSLYHVSHPEDEGLR